MRHKSKNIKWEGVPHFSTAVNTVTMMNVFNCVDPQLLAWVSSALRAYVSAGPTNFRDLENHGITGRAGPAQGSTHPATQPPSHPAGQRGSRAAGTGAMSGADTMQYLNKFKLPPRDYDGVGLEYTRSLPRHATPRLQV